MKGLVLAVLIAGMAAGCSAPPNAQVRYFWPIPPDAPRLEFIGSYKAANDLPHNFWSRLMESSVGSSKPEEPLVKPRGIFAGSEKIYVADENHRDVMVFNFPERTIDPLFQTALLASPLDIAGDRQGNLYIADAGLKKILVFSPESALLRAFGENEGLQRPTCLAINEGLARLYVSDSAANRITAYDLSGNWLFHFGTQGDGAGQFQHPQGLAIDRTGRVFVADKGNARIQVFDQEGKYEGKFGQRGKTVHDFLEPTDLAFDSEGNLHVIDQGLIALLTYSPDGRVLLATGSGAKSRMPMGLARPVALHIDEHDRIYISDDINRRVSIWQYLSGDYLAKFPIEHDQFHALQTYLSQATGGRISVSHEEIEKAYVLVQQKLGEDVAARPVKCRDCDKTN